MASMASWIEVWTPSDEVLDVPRMLVTACAEAGVDHQLLFTTAAPHLARSVKYMNGRDAVDVSLGQVDKIF